MDQGDRELEYGLGGGEGRETMVRMYCMRKELIKNNRENLT